MRCQYDNSFVNQYNNPCPNPPYVDAILGGSNFAAESLPLYMPEGILMQLMVENDPTSSAALKYYVHSEHGIINSGTVAPGETKHEYVAVQPGRYGISLDCASVPGMPTGGFAPLCNGRGRLTCHLK